MAVKNIVQAVPLTHIASTSVSGTYAAINTNGLPNACFMIRIINTGTTDVTVSYDGTNDHEYVPSGAVVQLNFQTNSQPNNYIANLAAGTKVYIKGSAGMSGNIYLSAYFQPSGG